MWKGQRPLVGCCCLIYLHNRAVILMFYFSSDFLFLLFSVDFFDFFSPVDFFVFFSPVDLFHRMILYHSTTINTDGVYIRKDMMKRFLERKQNLHFHLLFLFTHICTFPLHLFAEAEAVPSRDSLVSSCWCQNDLLYLFATVEIVLCARVRKHDWTLPKMKTAWLFSHIPPIHCIFNGDNQQRNSSQIFIKIKTIERRDFEQRKNRVKTIRNCITVIPNSLNHLF